MYETKLPTRLALVGLLLLGACSSSDAPDEGSALSEARPRAALGEAIDGLSGAQRRRFEAGRSLFEKVFTPQNGLGAVFNGQSCAECHADPAAGGAHPSTAAERFRMLAAPSFTAGLLTQSSGAPHVHARSVAEEFPDAVPGCELARETVPESATAATVRVTPPLFGIGLIEAIPDASIIANGRESAARFPEISGRAGTMFPGGINDMNQLGKLVGRFGARGFVADVLAFTQGAFRTELGISTPHPVFGLPLRPHGQPTPPECAPFSGQAVDLEEARKVADFQRWLAPPPRGEITPAVERGEALFETIGCAACHTPVMRTAANAPEPLADREVRLYSDLLLHDMGEGLADGAPEGLGGAREWRTSPLWGIGAIDKPLLHDGRAGRDFALAIEWHGGEAAATRERFLRLAPKARQDLIRFLESL